MMARSAALFFYKIKGKNKANVSMTDHTEVTDMTMEPIQSTTVAYQGSGVAVEKTTSAPKTEIKAPERNTPVADYANKAAAGDKVTMSEQASDSSLKNAVEQLNRKSANMEAVFGYHEGTNRVMIKIIDKDTKEVKKEYPAEKTLDMIQKVWEMAGIMVDEKR